MIAIKTKKKRRISTKSKIRIFFSLIIFGAITVSLFYNCIYNIVRIKELKEEEVKLKNEQLTLSTEHEELENDILKLNDKNYIARYVREKYLYSKDGELILRIEE